jgi:hypothetical protein
VAAPWCNHLREYEVVVEAANRRVVMNVGLEKEYRKIATKDKATLRRWMELWCDDVDGAIPDTRLKAQHRYADAQGRNVLIFAFKAYQARLYGFIREIEGKLTFLITAADSDKKDDGADQKVLDRASGEAFRILKTIDIR